MPIEIFTAEDLNTIVRANLSESFIQRADIDLSGFSHFEPLGSFYLHPNGWYEDNFMGNYNGYGFKVKNLRIRNSTIYAESIGLFGALENAGVYNLTIENPDIEGDDPGYGVYTGGALTGAIFGSDVKNCHIKGGRVSITGTEGVEAGALAGYSVIGCLVQKSSTKGVDVASEGKAGGIIGYAATAGIFEDCFAQCDVSSANVAGGFVATANGPTFRRCYSAGHVSAPNVGGFVAIPGTSSFESCYYDAWVSGLSDTNGGSNPRTTEQMKQKATFDGWDFDSVWNITEGVTYPHFDRLILVAPTVLTAVVRSANPEIAFTFPRMLDAEDGPPIHFRLEVFADSEMTQLIDIADSRTRDFWAYPVFSRWRKVPHGGWSASIYSGHYLPPGVDFAIKTQVSVGPRRQVYVRASVGMDA